MQETNDNNNISSSEGCAMAVPPPLEGVRGRPVVSKYQSLKHYKWGNDCDGWNFVDEVSLSVKQERMPAGTSEAKHYHEKAQHFFFILKGKATFEIEDDAIEVNEGEGLHIEAGKKHRIINNTFEDLEFILCSQPSTVNDRINCK